MLTHFLLLPCVGVGGHILGLDMPSFLSIDSDRGRLVTQPEAAWASEPAQVGGCGRVLVLDQHH